MTSFSKVFSISVILIPGRSSGVMNDEMFIT